MVSGCQTTIPRYVWKVNGKRQLFCASLYHLLTLSRISLGVPFVAQQSPLDLPASPGASKETSQPVARAHYPMAGDDYGKRITPEGVPDRPGCSRHVQGHGDLLVGPDVSERDCRCLSEDAPLERCCNERVVDLEGEGSPVPLEVFQHLVPVDRTLRLFRRDFYHTIGESVEPPTREMTRLPERHCHKAPGPVADCERTGYAVRY